MDINTHPESVNLHKFERYASAAGGILLTMSGIRQGFRGGGVRMLLGAEMLRRGITGHSYAYQAFGVRTLPRTGHTSVPYELGVHVRVPLTIDRPREEVFAFWRDFTKLPSVMRNLVSVEKVNEIVTRWTVRGPLGRQHQWDAAIVNEVPNEKIAWRSLEGSQVDNAGTVRFSDAPGRRGTQILVVLQYNPPAGYVGAFAARLFGKDAKTAIESDCLRLKQSLETRGRTTADAAMASILPESAPSTRGFSSIETRQGILPKQL